ncbi:MAG: exodeoxyribonuclease V subunit gamma [Planctomycetia bacterium]|nr:exodeoxyribonuclease V subunit gamma [Planctomycetia bacterium]
MPLAIRYVSSLREILDPAEEFLSRDRDLFAKPRIVVPTAGAKAWLWSELATRLGAGGGGDGIVANVEISYPGTLLSLLQPPRSREPDPWSFDRLTFAVLDVITGPDADALGIPFDVHREPLLTARRIAGLFDEYHVRRPGMILEWDRDTPTRHMNPTANDVQQNGEPIPDLLPDQDRWQFDLWRIVRQRIARKSPPARASVAHRGPHSPLLVAGLQSLSWPQLQALEELATACDVEALLVHPSPGLRAEWQKTGPQPLEEKLRGRPLRRNSRKSEAEAAEADEPVLSADFDPLPAIWLSGARELQTLITSQGVAVVDVPEAGGEPPTSLLERMQCTVASGRNPESVQHDPAVDHSITIHRCHSLSRQAEVLHESLLHAFADPKRHGLAGLQPHDVVIVSPCLDKAAPHLEAVFQRTVVGLDHEGKERKITLPLVVADRGLRETSEAIDLLSRVLALPGSRCSVDDVLGVAGHPLVRPHLGIDDDTVAAWENLLAQTQVRWGLDHGHRERRGLSIGDVSLRDIHTWKSGLEQMLLGALLPDDTPKPELGGVVPLAGLDPADVASITKLIRVLEVVGVLAGLSATPRPAAEWCDAIELALVALCGERCRQLAEPLAELRRLREAAAGAAADRRVAFEEIRTLLAEWFAEQAGRQPLRTGAITATSMVPLRGVPFRVVCVIGYDDKAFGATDPSKDDLVAKMPLVGDVDPRSEGRRALLDCLLAAEERLVITCTGRDVKTNEVVPLVTPLAELADFAVRHGVAREKITGQSGIEIDQPRHHLGRKNFLPGSVQPGVIWSHDPIAAQVARAVGERPGASVAAAGRTTSGSPGIPPPAAVAESAEAPSTEKPEIDVAFLEQFVRDPLGLYLEQAFGVSTWRADEMATPATLPLALGKKAVRELTLELLTVLATDPHGQSAWEEAMVRSGRLPHGPHGDRQLEEIVLLAQGLRDGLAAHELNYAARVAEPLGAIDLEHFRLVGNLENVEPKGKQLLFVSPKEIKAASFGRPIHAAAIKLLAARAADIDVSHATIISRRDNWKPGKKSPTKKEPDRLMEVWQARIVRLADELMAPHAARRRLCDIAVLIKEAVAAPRPAFGGVIACKREARPDQFDQHVTSDWYPSTSEFTVYGNAPEFEAVFAPGSERVQFLDGFQQFIDPSYVSAAVGYRLS